MITRTTIVATVLTLAAFIAVDATAAGPIRRLMPDKLPGGKVVEGTKSAVAGAYDRLTFWNNKKPKRESNAFIEGTGRFFRPDLVQKEKDRKAFSLVRPASWFEEVEPDPGPQTVHDWIGQPRPGDF